ncbi:DUF4836 family protein [Chitinophaga sp.]|uniref:DUF4836 family protein n=1 Tax=Chitinophaga sp. TaxID=1869181 RepID=UPI0026302897|nr:DUF4836 family protein [uncultured Chitinophaga sp.]
MKRSIQQALLFLTGAAVLLLASCSKAPEQGKHIPKNAALVFGFKSKQIQDKLAKDGLTIDKVFETLQQNDTSNNYAKALADAKNSGIDLQGDLFFAMIPGESAGSMYMTVIADVADAGKLEAFIKEKSKKEVKAGKDFKFVEDDNNVVGFTGKTMIAVASVDQSRSYFDAEDTSKPATGTALLEKLFTLKADESVASIASFKDISKEKGDMLFWMSSESLYGINGGNTSGMGALMASNMKKITEGAFTTASANFETGKIDVDMYSYASKEMMAIIKKYPMEKINLENIEKYPSDNIFGYAAVNCDLRVVGELIKLIGMDGLVNMGLAEARFTLDDLLTAFKGEITMVGSDFSTVAAPTEWDSTRTKPQLKWIFSMKVGDKAAFEKVMASPMLAQALTKQGDEYVPNMPLGDELSVSINSKRVLAGSDAELIKAYDAGSGKAKLEGDALDNAKGSIGAFYLDVEKIMAAIPAKEMDVPDSISNDIKTLVKSISAKSNEISGDKSHSSAVVLFKDQSKNALSQLFNFTNKVYNWTNAKKKAEAAQWGEYNAEEAQTATDSVEADAAIAAPAAE